MSTDAVVEDGKTYKPMQDLWVDDHEQIFVRNEFDPNQHVWIDVTGDYWTTTCDAHYEINWRELLLAQDIKNGFKRYLRVKLKRNSPSFIRNSSLAMKKLAALLSGKEQTLQDFQMDTFVYVWKELNPHYVSWLREAYSWLTNNDEPGTSFPIAQKLHAMKARNDVRLLGDVLNWHPTKGALTVEEETILRASIEAPNQEYTCQKQWGLNLYCWVLMTTLKRSKQLLEMRLDCLKVIETNEVKEFFILMKPVKAQTGDLERWWPIPESLYHEMRRYSTTFSIAKLQKTYDRFWVMDETSLRRDGISMVQVINTSLRGYIKNTLKLVSPRTMRLLHITPRRIRHTGATRLAARGVPHDIIAEILEHDSPDCCVAYIDAVGSDLCPNIDKADRNMGSLFMQLNNAYFNGQIIEKLNDQPIVVPEFADKNALFIGSCGRDTCSSGQCKKHPFIGCYNGCPDFLAWREADHQRAFDFADKEIVRWRNASGHKDQASTIMEFENLKANITRVMNNIEVTKETLK